MLALYGTDKFEEVVKKAKINGSAGNLLERIAYLANYGDDDFMFRTRLYPEDEHSFGFCIDKNMGYDHDPKWETYMNGGLIYHDFDNSWGVHT